MQQQGGSNQDDSLGPMWMAAAFIVAVIAIWYFGHAYIVAFVLKIKLAEAEFISIFTSSITPQIQWIKSINPASVTFKHLAEFCTIIGDYLKYPIAGILFALAAVLFFGSSTVRFRETYTTNSLLKNEVVNWPQVNPVVKLDLVNTPLDEGPWAMSLQPMMFAKRYRLLREEEARESDEDDDEIILGDAPPKVKLLKGEATRIFTLQLGSYWMGAERLPIHIRALFAIFAARINHDSAAAAQLISQIGVSTAQGELSFAGVDALLDKYKDSGAVRVICERHAYVMTVMATMLEQARTDGVMATADFLWLKPIDRRMWYMLNNVGRPTAYAEVAGAMSHWLAEKTMHRALHVPNVQEAVRALEEAISEVIYQPDMIDNITQDAFGDEGDATFSDISKVA